MRGFNLLGAHRRSGHNECSCMRLFNLLGPNRCVSLLGMRPRLQTPSHLHSKTPPLHRRNEGVSNCYSSANSVDRAGCRPKVILLDLAASNEGEGLDNEGGEDEGH